MCPICLCVKKTNVLVKDDDYVIFRPPQYIGRFLRNSVFKTIKKTKSLTVLKNNPSRKSIRQGLFFELKMKH
jgi:hypothetical protein